MSLSLTKKVVGGVLGLGTTASTSYGIYTLTDSSKTLDKAEEIPQKTSSLSNFKKLAKDSYGPSSLAKSLDDMYEYLSTDKENQGAWEEMWKFLEGEKDEDGELLELEYIEDLDDWVINSFNAIDKGFDENKGKNSLNGLCERLYKKKYEESLHDAAMYICSRPDEVQ